MKFGLEMWRFLFKRFDIFGIRVESTPHRPSKLQIRDPIHFSPYNNASSRSLLHGSFKSLKHLVVLHVVLKAPAKQLRSSTLKSLAQVMLISLKLEAKLNVLILKVAKIQLCLLWTWCLKWNIYYSQKNHSTAEREHDLVPFEQ